MHAFKSYSNQKVSILSYCKMICMYQTAMGTFHPLWHGRGGSQESETETIY